MDMNMKQTMWLQKLPAIIFPSTFDIMASQHLAFMAIWWHCVSLPLPAFLGCLGGDLLDVWLQVLEDCSELVLVHFNHELIVGAPGFGAKAMHHGATHIKLHNHVHGLLGCLGLLGILIAYAFSIWCRHQRHGQSSIPFGLQSLEQF